MSEPKSMASVIGQNARHLRTTGGVTLEALAAEARAAGLKWSTARVVDLERGKLSPTLPMLIALAYALGRATGSEVRLADLVRCEGTVEVNDKISTSGETLEAVLAGEPVRLWDRTWAAVAEAQRGYPEEVRTLGQAYVHESYGLGDERAARKLGLSRGDMIQRSASLWGKNLSAERDERAGPDASAQKRGQVTRALLEELRGVANGDR
jgi:transcriptional regulator with XRE-family HTH domain